MPALLAPLFTMLPASASAASAPAPCLGASVSASPSIAPAAATAAEADDDDFGGGCLESFFTNTEYILQQHAYERVRVQTWALCNGVTDADLTGKRGRSKRMACDTVRARRDD